MYEEYAYRAGFDVRLSNNKRTNSGRIYQKWYICSRAGNPPKMRVDTLENVGKQVRKSNIQRTGCRAMVRFDAVGEKGCFRLAVFEEIHNHLMVPPQYRHLSKHDRKLKYAEQLFVYKATVCNIGPTKAHQLYSTIKGTDENVNGTVTDFRNWSRDLNVYISDSDSQMLINKMEEKKEYYPGFSFYYKAEDSVLHSLFWADEVAKCNYNEFSDIMSFDATYQTNRSRFLFYFFLYIY